VGAEGGPRAAPTGVLRLALLGLVWGATFPVARWGISAGADPFVLVTVDLALATGAVALVAALSRARWPVATEWGRSAIVGALLIAGINLPLFWGEQYATGGTAAIVYATSPLVSFAFARGAGARLALAPTQQGALALGLLGVILLAVLSAGTNVLASPFAILAFALGAVCQGAGAVVFARLRPDGEGTWGLAGELLGATAVAAVLLPWLARGIALPDRVPVAGSIAFLAFGTLAGGYLLYFALVRDQGPVRANVVTFLNPAVALAVGILAFGEPFQPSEILGLALVLASLLLLAWRRAPRRSPAPSPGVSTESPAPWAARGRGAGTGPVKER
jgi:drug/metabolite transporter (DMT)-like permease